MMLSAYACPVLMWRMVLRMCFAVCGTCRAYGGVTHALCAYGTRQSESAPFGGREAQGPAHPHVSEPPLRGRA
eukprot:3784508-Rhodomonas_salina.1